MIVTCAHCQTTVKRKHFRMFCSPACRSDYATANYVARPCPQCGGPRKKNNKAKYCSRTCAVAGAATNTWNRPKWDEKFRARITELWSAGMSTAAIGQAMVPQVSKNVVIGLAKRLGLPGRPSPLCRAGVPDPYPKHRPGRPAGSVNKRTIPALPDLASLNAPIVVAVRKPPPPPPPRPAVPPAPVSPHRTCQWIESDPKAGRPVTFCGEPTRQGSSYCEAHHWRCYIRRPTREAFEDMAA